MIFFRPASNQFFKARNTLGRRDEWNIGGLRGPQIDLATDHSYLGTGSTFRKTDMQPN
jgi:hypothetical protein